MKGINEMTKQNLIRAQREREAKDIKEKEEYRRTLLDNDQKVINWEEMSYDARQEFIKAASEGESIPSPKTPPRKKKGHDPNTGGVVAREIALMSSSNFVHVEEIKEPRREPITVKHLYENDLISEGSHAARQREYLAS